MAAYKDAVSIFKSSCFSEDEAILFSTNKNSQCKK
jgi:hypothetical protein